jgi:uncharacterized DUF497 family protein
MRTFRWDESKNKTNQKDHGVSLETAQLVFDDPFHLTFVESVKDGEERWHAIGMVGTAALLIVVHTYMEDGANEVIRIISCRQASRHERKLYEEGR